MRRSIDNFAKFAEKRKQSEVIVSYDCSQIHRSFAVDLRTLLKGKYNSSQITLSNYIIGGLLTFDEIDILKKEILGLFSDALITEGVREKRTVVSVIIPSENQFFIDEIINEPVE